MPGVRTCASLALGLILALGSASAQDGRPADPPVLSSYKLRLHQAIGDRARRIRNRSTTDGTATLKLVIAASGEVTASEIRASSGSPYIDGLVLKAVPVGSKLLPIPDELGSSTIAVVVPLRFTPRNR